MDRTAPPRDYERIVLASAAVTLMAAGLISLVVSDPAQGWEGIAIRAGAVIGAIWIALPNLRRMPRRLRTALGLLAVVIMVRPRLVLFALPVALGIVIFSRRRPD